MRFPSVKQTAGQRLISGKKIAVRYESVASTYSIRGQCRQSCAYWRAEVYTISRCFENFITHEIEAGASDVLAAVDVEFGAGDVARLLRAQIIDRLGDLFRLAEAAQGDRFDDLLRAGRKDRGVDFARRDGVHAHAERAEIRCD